MIKKNLDIKKQIVIIGAGAAGIFVKKYYLNIFSKYKSNYYRKKEIYNEDYEDFQEKFKIQSSKCFFKLILLPL